MKRLMAILLGVFFAGSAFAADPALIETFGCKLKEGRSMADFNSAVEAWRAQIDKLPAGRNYFAALLTPAAGYTPYDLVWIGSIPSVSEWAKFGAAGDASPDYLAALSKIGTNATCENALYLETPLFEGLANKPGDNDAIIETYGCNLKPGKTQKDADAFDAAYVAASKAIKATSYSTYRWAPFFGKATYQSVYLTVDDDLVSFAAATDALNASKEGKASNAAAAATFTCDSALWSGRVLRQPAAAPNH